MFSFFMRGVFRTLLGIGTLMALEGTYSCKKETAPVSSTPAEIQPVAPPVAQDTLPSTYTVQSGDYLWKISYRELGARGDSAITVGVKQIQSLSNLSLDKDVYKVVNGELVSGQDGLVDLIYRGDVLRIR